MRTDQLPSLRVLALSDERPGHYNQAKGVLKALERHWNLSVDWIELRSRSAITRRVGTWLLNLNLHGLVNQLLPLFYRGDPAPNGPYDLILSAGGNTLIANASLAKKFQCRNLFVGSVRQLNPRNFWRVLFYQDLDPKPPFIYWTITPTPIDAQRLKETSKAVLERLNANRGELWGLLVGGAGSGYDYSDQDWLNLINFVRTHSQQRHIRWLIATSRRTGAAAERILDALKDDPAVAFATFYSLDKGAHYFDVLGAGAVNFVTEDSHMMITESIYLQKPVFTLRPEKADPTPINKSFLEQYKENGYIQSLSIKSDSVPELTRASNFESPLATLGQLLTEALDNPTNQLHSDARSE